MPDLEECAFKVIGAAIEVHRALGPGFLEAVYEEALCYELELRNISFLRQHPIAIQYKGRLIGEGRIDILVEDCLIVELKAVDDLIGIHIAQVISYLKATQLHLGLLINFKVQVLKSGGIKRVVY
ncbi:MAG: GxxExxY protein [Anaerolineaceae bacterium]|nr:GxxExxY protein [Anaerolineaceae bacterium]